MAKDTDLEESKAANDGGSTPSAERLARRRDAKRYAILRAAGHELANSGYTAVSLDKIADAVNVSKAALYHYFPTKQDLYLEWLNMVHTAAKEAVHGVANGLGTPEQRLRLMIEREVLLLTTDFPDYARLFMRGMDWPDELSIVVHQHREEHENVFRQVLQEGIQAGVFDVPNDTIARHCIQGCLAYIPEWYNVGGPITPEAAGEAFATMCIRMVRMQHDGGEGTASTAKREQETHSNRAS